MKIVSRVASFSALAGMLNLSFVDLALAQTSEEMRAAAGLANSSEFKPDVSSLYSPQTGSNVEIIGVSPTGNISIPSSEFFFGIEGQGADAGALPDVDSYEELYGHRDQQLGDVQLGTGNFNSTGDLGAEALALELLNGSSNTPSVSSNFFLETTRGLLVDIDGASAEFGECIVEHVTEMATTTYDSSYEDVCDMPALDLQPMEAQRSYNGPPHLFTAVSRDGVLYCERGGNSVRTDSAATCSKLSILDSIPTTTNEGVVSVRSCQNVEGCIELVLAQSRKYNSVSVNFTIHEDINVTDAYVRGVSPDLGTVTYQGNSRNVGPSFLRIPEITSTEGATQIVSVFNNSGRVREPASGEALVWGPRGDPRTISWGLAILNWKGQEWRTPRNALSWTAPDGWTYHRHCVSGVYADCFRVWRTKINPSWSTTIYLQLHFNAQTFAPWAYNSARWAEMQSAAEDQACRINFTTLETAAKPNGCVNSLTGELCGNSIPVAPFTALSDRASTRIAAQLDCGFEQMEDSEGNAAFTEMGGTCQKLVEDPSCTFTSRECGDRLSDGTCLFYEDTFTCGTSTTYTSPVVQQINICDSNLSCMGEDCVINTGTDGSVHLAEAGAQLAAVDLILGDMDCNVDTNAANPTDELLSCEIFKGESQTCKKVTLGLANCCETPKDVSMADYLQLVFATSRLARTVEASSLANPVTSAWVNLGDMGRDSFSKLAEPLTQAWEGIVGNSNVAAEGASAVSAETIKQKLTNEVAEWTLEVFGEQATNALFQSAATDGGAAVTKGAIEQNVVLSSTASTIMSTVMWAYTIYTIVNVLAQVIFACDPEEVELGVRKALRSTHRIGSFCTDRVFGKCVRRETQYCMFNSPLARIFNEQARLQTHVSWGTPEYPNCQGITVAEFQKLDMDQVDLSEWTGIVVSSGLIDMQDTTDIDDLTGQNSTLGTALEDLYERENAIDRNINRMSGKDLDAARQDAVDDFGIGITQ